ncbi:hypothetical protein C8R47DRAFT_1078779 [Mycena vitilis]|nr:hypothetical protein C8R47DRAFT_1078779 [Mycena vitilis]
MEGRCVASTGHPLRAVGFLACFCGGMLMGPSKEVVSSIELVKPPQNRSQVFAAASSAKSSKVSGRDYRRGKMEARRNRKKKLLSRDEVSTRCPNRTGKLRNDDDIRKRNRGGRLRYGPWYQRNRRVREVRQRARKHSGDVKAAASAGDGAKKGGPATVDDTSVQMARQMTRRFALGAVSIVRYFLASKTSVPDERRTEAQAKVTACPPPCSDNPCAALRASLDSSPAMDQRWLHAASP